MNLSRQGYQSSVKSFHYSELQWSKLMCTTLPISCISWILLLSYWSGERGNRHESSFKDAVGVRYTGWAHWTVIRRKISLNTLSRIAVKRGMKSARRTHDQYHFTDGFLQDLQGEMAAWPFLPASVAHRPRRDVAMTRDEKRRFEAVFSDFLVASRTRIDRYFSENENGSAAVAAGRFSFLCGLRAVQEKPNNPTCYCRQRVRLHVVHFQAVPHALKRLVHSIREFQQAVFMLVNRAAAQHVFPVQHAVPILAPVNQDQVAPLQFAGLHQVSIPQSSSIVP